MASIDASSYGNIIRIGFNDPQVAKVIEAGFGRLLIERSVDAGLSYEELTVPSSRPVLEVDKEDYVYIDKMGDANYLYRSRYISETGKDRSDPSKPIKGLGALLLQVLTVEELKQRYFFGVDITDDQGKPLSDEVFAHYILQAVQWLEHQLDIPILPTRFESERHDYYRNDYAQFSIIQLDNYPVLEIEEFRVEYPSGQTVINFPEEWIRIDKNHGILRIVPTAGTLSEVVLGAGGSFLPAVYSGLDHLPDLFAVTYTAGFEDCKIPRNIIDLIGMFASLGPFNLFGDLVAGAGIASTSISIDGLSQSIGTTSSATNSGYGARIIQYLKQIKEQIPLLRRYYKGIRMVSI